MALPQSGTAPCHAVPDAGPAARNFGPSVELSFCLQQVPSTEPKRFTLKGTDQRITIGRRPSSDFVLTARSVSFDHAEIFLQRKGRDPVLTVRDVSKNMTGVRSAREAHNKEPWKELQKGETHVLQHLSELRVPFQERRPQGDEQHNQTVIKVIFVLPDAYCDYEHRGRWQYIEKLGEGGLAVVYRARDVTGPLRDFGQVAVKISKFSNLQETSQQSRHIYALHREAQWSLQRLHCETDHRYRKEGAALFARYLEDHTGFDAHSSGDFDTDRRHYESPDFKWDQKRFSPSLAQRPYVVMELIRGKLLQAAMEGSPPLSNQEKLAIVQQCAEAFAYMELHGVIHRDFRGCNLFLLDRGGSCRLKVIDLGFMISLEPLPIQTNNCNAAVRCAWQGDATKKLRFDWAPPEVQPKGSCNFGKPGTSFDAFSIGVLILKLLRGRAWTQEQLAKKCAGLMDAQPDMEAIGLPVGLVMRLLNFEDASKRPSPQTLLQALHRDSPLSRLRNKQQRQRANKTQPSTSISPAKAAPTPTAPTESAVREAPKSTFLQPVILRADDEAPLNSTLAPVIVKEKVLSSSSGSSSPGPAINKNYNEKQLMDLDSLGGPAHVSIGDSAWTPMRTGGGDDEHGASGAHEENNKELHQDEGDSAVANSHQEDLAPVVEEPLDNKVVTELISVPASHPGVADLAHTAVAASSAQANSAMQVSAQTPTEAFRQIQASWRKTQQEPCEESRSSSSSSSESSRKSTHNSSSDKADSEEAVGQEAQSRSQSSRRDRSRKSARSRRRRRQNHSKGIHNRNLAAPPWCMWQDSALAQAAAMKMNQDWIMAQNAWWLSQNPWAASAVPPWTASVPHFKIHEKRTGQSDSSLRQSRRPPENTAQTPPPSKNTKDVVPMDSEKEEEEASSLEAPKPQHTTSTAAPAAHATARCKVAAKPPPRELDADHQQQLLDSAGKCAEEQERKAKMTADKAKAFARPKAARIPPPPPPPPGQGHSSGSAMQALDADKQGLGAEPQTQAKVSLKRRREQNSQGSQSSREITDVDENISASKRAHVKLKKRSRSIRSSRKMINGDAGSRGRNNHITLKRRRSRSNKCSGEITDDDDNVRASRRARNNPIPLSKRRSRSRRSRDRNSRDRHHRDHEGGRHRSPSRRRHEYQNSRNRGRSARDDSRTRRGHGRKPAGMQRPRDSRL